MAAAMAAMASMAFAAFGKDHLAGRGSGHMRRGDGGGGENGGVAQGVGFRGVAEGGASLYVTSKRGVKLLPKNGADMAGRINTANLRTIVSVAILVGTEIIAASLALGWAMGGLLNLSDTLRAVLVGACLLAGCYVVYLFVRKASRVEPIRE